MTSDMSDTDNALLPPNQAVDGHALALPRAPLDADKCIAGTPQVGLRPLGELGGIGFGVWELGPSTSRDIEADEVFVVLSGRATVAFGDGTPPLQLQPGSIARLAAGSATTWTITETLRKLYIA
jgi:uncharacterized cupin superfamily protein